MAKRADIKHFGGGAASLTDSTRVLGVNGITARRVKSAHPLINLLTSKKHAAFTLTEVLVALVIVGIIAALVLPNIITHYQNRSFDQAFQRQTQTIQSAIEGLTVSENKAKFFDTIMYKETEPENYDDSAKEFIKNYLRPTKICETNKDCFAPVYYEFTGNDKKVYTPELKGACAKLKNGSSLCITPQVGTTPITGTIDINGAKGPNVFGKDLRTFTYTAFDDLSYNRETDAVLSYNFAPVKTNEPCTECGCPGQPPCCDANRNTWDENCCSYYSSEITPGHACCYLSMFKNSSLCKKQCGTNPKNWDKSCCIENLSKITSSSHHCCNYSSIKSSVSACDPCAGKTCGCGTLPACKKLCSANSNNWDITCCIENLSKVTSSSHHCCSYSSIKNGHSACTPKCGTNQNSWNATCCSENRSKITSSSHHCCSYSSIKKSVSACTVDPCAGKICGCGTLPACVKDCGTNPANWDADCCTKNSSKITSSSHHCCNYSNIKSSVAACDPCAGKTCGCGSLPACDKCGTDPAKWDADCCTKNSSKITSSSHHCCSYSSIKSSVAACDRCGTDPAKWDVSCCANYLGKIVTGHPCCKYDTFKKGLPACKSSSSCGTNPGTWDEGCCKENSSKITSSSHQCCRFSNIYNSISACKPTCSTNSGSWDATCCLVNKSKITSSSHHCCSYSSIKNSISACKTCELNGYVVIRILCGNSGCTASLYTNNLNYGGQDVPNSTVSSSLQVQYFGCYRQAYSLGSYVSANSITGNGSYGNLNQKYSICVSKKGSYGNVTATSTPSYVGSAGTTAYFTVSANSNWGNFGLTCK